MTPVKRGPYSRILIPLLVAAGGIAIGVGGVIVLRPLESAAPARPSASAAEADRPASRTGATSAATPRPLSDRAIYARVEPSVVDVTTTLGSTRA